MLLFGFTSFIGTHISHADTSSTSCTIPTLQFRIPGRIGLHQQSRYYPFMASMIEGWLAFCASLSGVDEDPRFASWSSDGLTQHLITIQCTINRTCRSIQAPNYLSVVSESPPRKIGGTLYIFPVPEKLGLASDSFSCGQIKRRQWEKNLG